AAVADRPRRGELARVRQGFLGLRRRSQPANLGGDRPLRARAGPGAARGDAGRIVSGRGRLKTETACLPTARAAGCKPCGNAPRFAACIGRSHSPAPDARKNRMLDLNNRPGGPNLIVTAKTAHKVHFLDAATLTMAATIDMPGSTHELALSLDGR